MNATVAMPADAANAVCNRGADCDSLCELDEALVGGLTAALALLAAPVPVVAADLFLTGNVFVTLSLALRLLVFAFAFLRKCETFEANRTDMIILYVAKLVNVKQISVDMDVMLLLLV